RYPDFIEAGIDVAIRTREHEGDSGITVRKLAETRRVLAASPGYLAERGMPDAPDALRQHQMLIYNLANDPYLLHFRRGDETATVPVTSVLDSNEGQVIRAAALAGHGILVQPLYIIYEDIVAGRLVPVLPDWQLPK
ncbi:substrate binding domain-containing protein, partial [Escherichia coli]